MKIEVVLDGRVVSTQWNVDPKALPDVLAARKQALRAAIDNNGLRISQALRATVELVDDVAVYEGVASTTNVAVSRSSPPKPKDVITFRK